MPVKYEVEITRDALKFLKKLKPSDKSKVILAMESLALTQDQVGLEN